MKKFKKLLRLMSYAADLTLYTVVFICGIWISLIPIGLVIFFYSRAWRATDVTLTFYERLNLTIKATFWETLAALALMIVLRNITYWAIRYAKEKESESESE